jgi:hypothetical protein
MDATEEELLAVDAIGPRIAGSVSLSSTTREQGDDPAAA